MMENFKKGKRLQFLEPNYRKNSSVNIRRASKGLDIAESSKYSDQYDQQSQISKNYGQPKLNLENKKEEVKNEILEVDSQFEKTPICPRLKGF